MSRLRRILVLASAMLALLAMFTAAVAPTSAAQSAPVSNVRLQPVNGSGVTGFVTLAQLPQVSGGGTFINVTAFGLTPGNQYLSLYYGNNSCHIKPYDAGDVIGGTTYTANQVGVGTTRGRVEDNLDDINSVSVRTPDLTLVACAVVHP
jgi:hypothetical protein